MGFVRLILVGVFTGIYVRKLSSLFIKHGRVEISKKESVEVDKNFKTLKRKYKYLFNDTLLFKSKIEARKKAELIAELLSEWLAFPESQIKLNKLTFEAFLWLPDEIAKDLSDLLAHKKNAPEVRDILLKIRKYLLNNKTNLEPKEIIIFTQEHIKKLFEKAINESKSS